VSAALLDSNVLIALLWRGHEFHQTAQRWFSRNARNGWATCALTQAAFVRIVSNPAFSPNAASPAAAIALLESNLNHPHHRYWREEGTFLDAIRDFAERIQGHRQVTDAYLLGLALLHKGRLVTFDRGIAGLLPHGGRHSAVEVIGAG
jgi:toxin-antitoxin system PIN domain toxin